MGRLTTGFVLCVLALGCQPIGAPPAGAIRGAIIGGIPDAGHPAVGAILIGADGVGGLCTGTLISPKVVLTAAHCVQGEDGLWPATFVLGSSLDSGTAYSIATSEPHPDYDPDADGQGLTHHDIAVVVLSEAVDVAPMPYRTLTLDGQLDRAITFSGFGIRSLWDESEVGEKYKVASTIGSIEDQGFWNYTTSNNPKNTCSGDSGGPSFLVEDGIEQIIGVVSTGDYYCQQDGWNTRTDVNAAFLARMITRYDGTVTPPICGNGACEAGETRLGCPADCDAGNDLWGACGDDYACPGAQFCVEIEDRSLHCTIECDLAAAACPDGYECAELEDGGGACVAATAPECGNGECESGETTATCAADCPAPGPVCGNGTCESGETTATCAADCPAPGPVCGNGECESGETTATCATDCPAPGPVCGNGECESGETTATCATDCPAPGPVCGNGTCESGETTATCAADCPAPGPVCGNGECENGEATATCAADCPAPGPACGNGTCESGETTATCATDCPAPGPACGNGTCESGETTATCATDCPAPGPVCGNGECENGEATATCAADCPAPGPACGNGTCESGETTATCATDCPAPGPVCGNGTCEDGESCDGCPQDCGACEGGTDAVEPPEDGTPPARRTSGGCSGSSTPAGASGALLVFLIGVLALRQPKRQPVSRISRRHASTTSAS